MFLLDDSGSVTSKNFIKVKNFVIDIVRSLQIGKEQVRVGVLSFNSNVYIRFYLNTYFDQRRMINAISNIRYTGGGTNTHLALRKLRRTAFTDKHGDRKDVHNIAIVITDGRSYNSRATKLEAARLKKLGVVMFSIGIGYNLRQSELIAMASRPVSEHKFTIANFVDLQKIKTEITKKVCEGKYTIYISWTSGPDYFLG